MKFFNKAKLMHIILIILGINIFINFNCIRLLYEKLPKVLPFFNLSSFALLFLIYICCIYIFILYIYLKKNRTENVFISNLIKNLYLPLISLDNYIKSFPIIKNLNYKFLLFLAQRNFWYYNKGLFFFYLFEIFPRIILVTTFILDTYYFRYLADIYKILFLGILIFIGKYIKYSYKNLKENIIAEKANLIDIEMDYEYAINIINDTPPEDPEEEDFIPDNMCIPMKEFVEYQIGLKLENKEIFPYNISISTKGFVFIREKYGETSLKFRRNLTVQNEQIIKELLEISYIYEYLETNSTNKNIKNLKILVFMNYLLLWIYIIIISIPYTKIDWIFFLNILEILKTYINNENFI